MTLFPGVLVFKRGRNGQIRRIHLLLYQKHTRPQQQPSSSGNNSCCLVWKSKVVGQKIFRLDTLQSLHTLTGDSPTEEHYITSTISTGTSAATSPATVTSGQQAAPNPTYRGTSSVARHITSKSSSLPTAFIQLRNHNRSLDIQFYSAIDSAACLALFSKYLPTSSTGTSLC